MGRWRLSSMAVGIGCVWLVLSVVGLGEVWRRSRLRPAADDDAADVPAPTPTPATSTPTPTSTPAAATRTAPPAARVLPSATPGQCRRTHGADPVYTTDDRGYTCVHASVDAATGCCSPWMPRYACNDCRGSCCGGYARCVSCCMGRTGDGFAACAGTCRTSSRSLDRTTAYADAGARFCWAHVTPSRAPGTKLLDLSAGS